MVSCRPPRQDGRLWAAGWMPERGSDDVRLPAPLGRGVIAGAGRVPGVRDRFGRPLWAATHTQAGLSAGTGALSRPATQPPGEPVVRQHHLGHPGGVRGLMVSQPAQLGHGERGIRHAAGPGRPPRRSAPLLDQVGRCRGGPPVVPEQGRPDDLTGLVKHHHPVLLPGDPDRGRLLQQALARLGQCGPPCGRVALGTSGMRRASPADDGAIPGLAQKDLGGLCRRIHPGHEHAAPLPC